MYKLFILIFLASCMSAPKHLQKAIDKDRPYVASETRKLWPCITKDGKPDSTAYKQYLEDLKTLEDFYQSQEPQFKTDTLAISWTDSAKVVDLKRKISAKDAYIAELKKICRDKPPIHDTIPVKDSADVYIIMNNMEVQTNMYREDTARVNKENRRLQAKVNKQRATKTWLWIILGIIVAWNVFKIYRKIALR